MTEAYRNCKKKLVHRVLLTGGKGTKLFWYLTYVADKIAKEWNWILPMVYVETKHIEQKTIEYGKNKCILCVLVFA